MDCRGPGLLAVVFFEASEARPVTQRKTEEERQLADGRGEGEGTESYIGEKAWSSKTHLVLSVSAPIHSLHFVISTERQN
jgi:hypothetical protein